MREIEYCEVAECEDPTDGHGPFCAMHAKRKQRGKDMHAPKAENLNPKQRALEAGIKVLEADAELDNEEYEALERAWVLACRVLGRKSTVDVIRRAMAEAKARGLRIGRPPKLTRERAEELVRKKGSIARAARAARVSRTTLYRALGTCSGVQKGTLSEQSPSGPRSSGGSP